MPSKTGYSTLSGQLDSRSITEKGFERYPGIADRRFGREPGSCSWAALANQRDC
jgi:hypothetical protein